MATAKITQANRTLSFSTPAAAKDALVVVNFSASDAISGLFRYTVSLLADLNTPIDMAGLLGRKATVTLALPNTTRYFSGVIGRVTQGERDKRFVYYRAEVYPWLWLLSHKSDCRIFQNKTVPEILHDIFDELKKTNPNVNYRDVTTSARHAKIDCCIQYRETDFNFVSRLMEQEGIFYFFEHEADKHTLVLADSNTAIKLCPSKSTFNYVAEGGYGEREDTIEQFEKEQQLRPGKYTLRDHHFELPSKSLEADESTTVTAGSNDSLEVYDYPGLYAHRFNHPAKRLGDVEPEGRKLVRLRMEEEELPCLVFRGRSDSRFMLPGYKFRLVKHFNCDGEYVVTSVSYDLAQNPSYISGVPVEHPVRCSFTCVPSSTPIRPSRRTPKPLVQGSQTATVVVKSGEESWLDKYGRVRIQFHWDRKGKKDEASTCWVRVAQPWAGEGWGGHFWPRAGQEVVVDFLEGDPDQPIVTGSVYNAANMPPYTLPDKYTVSGIQTRSSKNGNDKNYNELRFEDKTGNEQVFIHAEKDMDNSVENDSREHIGNNRHLVIANNQLEQVGNNKDTHVKGVRTEKVDGNVVITVGADHVEKISGEMSHHVSGDRKDKIGGNASLTVAGDWKTKAQSFSLDAAMNHDQKVGMNYGLEAGMQMHLKAGMTLVIESGVQLSLKCGACFIDMNPAMMSISAPMVMINSGGAAGSGSGASPKAPDAPKDPSDPKDPDKADDGSKFTKL